MAESVRELVVTLSLEAGNFAKTASNIQAQIKGVEAEFKAMGDGSGAWEKSLDGKKAKLSSLGNTLKLQEANIENYTQSWKKARVALDNATDDKSRLAAAKHLNSVESDLNRATAAANKTAAEIRQLQAEINAFNFNKFGSAMTAAGRQMQSFGRDMSIYVTAPIVALGTKAYKSAMDYESAFAGVKKTTEATTEEFVALNAELLAMSEAIPVNYTELAGIMEMGGSGGIALENLGKFTKIMALLGVTTDMSAEAVSNAMAQFLNVTRDGQGAIDRVGAALVDLGNKSSATESQIFEMAQRMAPTATQAGLTTDEILGLSAAMVSVGINAEAGGTAAGKLFKDMQGAAEIGSKAFKAFAENTNTAGMSIRDIQLAADDSKWVEGMAASMGKTKEEVNKMVDAMVSLDQYAKVSGTTLEGFAAQWDKDAGDSILLFFQGLSNLDEAGIASVLATLDEMGITEVRMSNMITAAANNPKLFSDLLGTAALAWTENTALYNEAAQRFATTESQNQLMLNKLQNAGADLGRNIITALEPMIKKVTSLIEAFNKLDEETQTKIVNIAGAFALLGPAALTIGTVTKAIGSLSSGIGSLVTALAGITAASVGPVIAMFGTIAGSGAALVALAAIVNSYKNPVTFETQDLKPIQDQLDGIVSTTEEITPALQKVIDKKAEYDKFMSAVTAPEYASGDWKAKGEIVAPFLEGYETEFITALNNGSLGALVKTMQSDMEKALGEAMSAAGLWIPEGLDLGIKDGRSGVLETANELATAVDEAVKNPLGIQSPSTVMRQHGLDIGLGIQLGILDGLPLAAAAMNVLGAALTAIASANGTAAGAAYGSAFSSAASIQVSAAMGSIKRELDQLNIRINRGYGNTGR